MSEDRMSPELSRWQGHVDAGLQEHTRRLDVLNGDAKAARKAAEEILVQLAIIKTKVAIWSSVGGLTGAGIVSIIVALVTK